MSGQRSHQRVVFDTGINGFTSHSQSKHANSDVNRGVSVRRLPPSQDDQIIVSSLTAGSQF